MVARYAPPISYNFLNLIRLGDNRKTIFEKRMGNIDDAVPFFGKGFNKIYPLIMVVYTLLVASNLFSRVIEFFGRWKRFKFRSEEEDTGDFDPSGMIILQKERTWLEQGRNVGEQFIPLARNFTTDVDIESGNRSLSVIRKKAGAAMAKDDWIEIHVEPLKDENRKYGTSREAIANKYAATRKQGRQSSDPGFREKNVQPASVALLEQGSPQNQHDGLVAAPSTRLASTWASMKTGFQSFKTTIGTKKFLPLPQVQNSTLHIRFIFQIAG